MGSTFELTFILPKPANAGGGRSKRRKVAEASGKTRTGATKRKINPTVKQTRLTDEQKIELRLVRAAETRQRRKELGLCKDCPGKAIKGKSRCPNCTEKQQRTKNAQYRRADPARDPQ